MLIMADMACSDTLARFYFNLFTRIFSATSVVCNLLVLVACQHQQKIMKIYGRMMSLAAGCNVFCSLIVIVVGMKTVPHGDLFFYFTDSPFLLYSSQLTQQLFVHVTFATFYVHAGLPAIQFFIRYKIIKDAHAGLSVLYTSFLGLVLFSCTYSFSYAIDFQKPSETWRQLLFSSVEGCNLDNVLPTYSVINKTSISSRIHKFLAVGVLCGSSVVVIYYGVLTWFHFKQRLGNTTYHATKFNRDLNLVLTFQAILPFTFIVLPNSLFLANLVPRHMASTVGLVANFGSTLSPLMDALIVLFIIPAFRKNVLKPLHGTTRSSSNTLFLTQ
ncbi:unnamed protein product [Bursaphelenchus xylophilus]|uniref:(pine wood nematode) hypothetical protein n=1 Tax=Bursaphelenchus xylophilus TaxID=6326 RepID=A0A1I7RW07_BURXY|nr:unnamed protein product [Bursaphelenchus xylophilus]CAG9094974.1 unnamed protein product [Bursaphelenchus xylophilus]